VSSILFLVLAVAGMAWKCTASADLNKASIHFSFRPIPFALDSCETPQKHAPETMAGGVAVFDYDNDGNLDIFFTNGADISSLKKTSPKYWNRLLRNNGDGTFTDVTEKAGLAGTGYDTGVAIGDYNNDGYEDIFVAGVHRNTLYRNNGDGTFTDVTEKTGLAQPDKEYGPLWSVGAAWVDVNSDGLLDLFVINYMSWDVNKEPDCKFNGKPEYCHPKLYKELPNQLFLNNGDGTFTDVSARSGIRSHLGKGMGVGIADYDDDGLPDIFVANDNEPNQLFHNEGNGAFSAVAVENGVAYTENGAAIAGMGADARDVDNDSWPDIFETALVKETMPLFRNLGHGIFQEITRESGFQLATERRIPRAAELDEASGTQEARCVAVRTVMRNQQHAAPLIFGRHRKEQPTIWPQRVKPGGEGMCGAGADDDRVYGIEGSHRSIDVYNRHMPPP